MKLFLKALVKYLIGALLVGVLVFVPAGDIRFFGGWLFMGVLFLPMLILGAVLLVSAPDLLEKRLDVKEKQSAQKGVVAFSGLIFLAAFILAGLDHRFSWTDVPTPVVIAATVLFLISYGLYGEVMRENAYLSRTVKVEEGQRVIDTGLYGVVRHPMYTATIFMFLSMPLMLDSLVSFGVLLLYPLLIVIRVLDEEKLLSRELEGYCEYKNKVKYRLIPFIW